MDEFCELYVKLLPKKETGRKFSTFDENYKLQTPKAQ